MSDEKIILWKYCLSDELPERNTQTGTVDTLDDHVLLHADLEILAGFLDIDTRGWSVARVVADKKDVEPLPNAPDGWYSSLRYIPSEGFTLLNIALRIYE